MREHDAQLDAQEASGRAGALAMVATMVQPARKKLSEAIERFLETYGVVDDQGTFRGDSEYNTFRKYRSSLRFLGSYCESHGIVYLNDDMGEALAGYRRSRTIGSVTWKTERQSLVTFFHFCIGRKWMTTNPAKDWSPPRNLKPNEVEPYSLADECKILAACDHIGGGKYNRSGARYEQLRAKAMVGLLRHTALRISDVAAFEWDAVSWDEENQTWRLRVRTQKTGEPVHLPIPDTLKMTLDALPLPRNAAKDCPYYFWNGVTSRRALVGIAERTLSAVFKKSGVKDAHAHRYRHTLATRLLGEGATFEQVADILGNSPEVVRKHYGKWSKGRQANIDRLMMAHFQTASTASQVTKKSQSETGAVN
jgi:integrase